MRTMIRYFAGALLLGAVGCDRPGPIEVIHDDAREPIQVNYLLGRESGNDSLVVTSEAETQFDLTGVLQTEDEVYPATMVVNGIESEFNGTKTQQSLSRVVLQDKSSPDSVVGNFGRFVKYQHLNVGNVRVNGTELDKEEVILQIRSSSNPIVRNGVLYKLLTQAFSQSKEFDWRPNLDYAVAADGKAGIHEFTKIIDSPDKVTLTNPKPYSLVFADEDLTLRWRGKSGESVVAVISFYDEAQKRVGRPIMELKTSSSTNAMLIPTKLLGLIPKTSNGKYVITLISANRKEVTVDGYSGRVLVQSASIHNVAVTLK